MAANEWPHGAHASDERQPHILQAAENAAEAGSLQPDWRQTAARSPREASGYQTDARPAPTPERLWAWYQVLGGLISCGAISTSEAESILSHALAAGTSPRELVEQLRAAVSPTLELAKSSESIFLHSSIRFGLPSKQ
jgi:hypothetical protein